MKKNIYLVLIFSLLLLGGCGNVQENAQTGTDTISKTPPVKATLSLTSDKQTVKGGDTFTVTVLLSNVQKEVTTVAPYLTYDPKMAEITLVDLSKTKFPISFRNVINAAKGVLELSLSTEQGKQGVTGDGLAVASVTLKAKQKGTITLSFDPIKTVVLLSDNTNVAPATFPSVSVTAE